MTQFDWQSLLAAGTRQLGLRPEQFWRLTPAELRVMLGQTAANAPMRMAGLMELMDRFPDAPKQSEKERPS